MALRQCHVIIITSFVEHAHCNLYPDISLHIGNNLIYSSYIYLVFLPSSFLLTLVDYLILLTVVLSSWLAVTHISAYQSVRYQLFVWKKQTYQSALTRNLFSPAGWHPFWRYRKTINLMKSKALCLETRISCINCWILAPKLFILK